MCHACHSIEWQGILSSGQGTVNSWVVLHHPPIPGYELPLAIAVIDLEEGTRIVANIVDCPIDEIHIDMPVECSIEEIEPGYKLPVFRRVAEEPDAERPLRAGEGRAGAARARRSRSRRA